ncbi:ets DNA-binding protein pokkuri-like isoform X2 [Macrobrachium nipponense]|uniref:ets DNA-binding protein pokkuri-like isoform X2 n=1 Tax=Macrobrachium nipponense TaxID=159736 RepID=UPI0030C7EF40
MEDFIAGMLTSVEDDSSLFNVPSMKNLEEEKEPWLPYGGEGFAAGQEAALLSGGGGGGLEMGLIKGGGCSNKDVADWGPQDCVAWAEDLCHSRGIDPTGVNVGGFFNFTGEMLMGFSPDDFRDWIDSSYGDFFHEEFRSLLSAATNVTDPNAHPAMFGTETKMEYYPHCDSFPKQDEEDYHIMDISNVMPPAPDDFFEAFDDLFSRGSDVDSFFDGSTSSSFVEAAQEEEEEEDSYKLNQELIDLGATNHGLHEVPGSPRPLPKTPTIPSYPILSPLTQPHASGTDVLSKIKTNSRKRERGPKNWEYLMRLLADRSYNPKVIRWEDEEAMTFRIVKPSMVAKIWGDRSNKAHLTYDNFARGLRYHYKTGALKAVSERQLVYKCGPKAVKYLQEVLNHVV